MIIFMKININNNNIIIIIVKCVKFYCYYLFIYIPIYSFRVDTCYKSYSINLKHMVIQSKNISAK